MTTVLWVIAVGMIAVGVIGTVLPALPGVAFVFGGILLAAWAENFARISGWTVGALGALALIGLLVDYLAAALSAQRVGASRLGIVGAAIGTLAGVFTGLIGVVFLPLVGAFVGELIARRDALRAGRVGLASWVGLLAATVVKIAIVFVMVGVFVAALIL
ncbi:MAG: DUF456 domain-containing protein [Gemmatimonadota bacterium]